MDHRMGLCPLFGNGIGHWGSKGQYNCWTEKTLTWHHPTTHQLWVCHGMSGASKHGFRTKYSACSNLACKFSHTPDVPNQVQFQPHQMLFGILGTRLSIDCYRSAKNQSFLPFRARVGLHSELSTLIEVAAPMAICTVGRADGSDVRSSLSDCPLRIEVLMDVHGN